MFEALNRRHLLFAIPAVAVASVVPVTPAIRNARIIAMAGDGIRLHKLSDLVPVTDELLARRYKMVA